MAVPDFIYAGPNKTASVWMYTAFDQHPDITMADIDPVNFFDVRYYEGVSWYEDQFPSHGNGQTVGEESPGYIKHPYAPERIRQTIPDVKIIFCFRNPMERAYSQWYHECGIWTSISFDRVLEYHPANDVFITPGYYHKHLQRWGELFPEDQLKVAFFDDFTADNQAFINDLYSFIGVDTYRPSVVGEELNRARSIPPVLNRIGKGILRLGPMQRINSLLGLKSYLRAVNGSRDPETVLEKLGRSILKPVSVMGGYDQGLEQDQRKRLEQVYAEDIAKLSEKTGRNLNHWFNYTDLSEIKA